MGQVDPWQQMLQQIEFDRRGDLRLGALIGNLEFLNDSTAHQGESWKRSVREKSRSVRLGNVRPAAY